MGADDQELQWKINNVREEIGLDWAILASKDFPADRRKVIREHLEIFNSSLETLKDLLERNRVGISGRLTEGLLLWRSQLVA